MKIAAHPEGSGLGCTSLEVPGFPLGMLLRPSNPREEEAQIKYAQASLVEISPSQQPSAPITGPTLGCQPGCPWGHGRWEAGGCSGCQTPRPRKSQAPGAQEMSKPKKKPSKNQVIRKKLSPRPRFQISQHCPGWCGSAN